MPFEIEFGIASVSYILSNMLFIQLNLPHYTCVMIVHIVLYSFCHEIANLDVSQIATVAHHRYKYRRTGYTYAIHHTCLAPVAIESTFIV